MHHYIYIYTYIHIYIYIYIKKNNENPISKTKICHLSNYFHLTNYCFCLRVLKKNPIIESTFFTRFTNFSIYNEKKKKKNTCDRELKYQKSKCTS